MECQKCGNKIGFLGKTYNWKEHQNICYSCYKNLLDRDTEEREKQKKRFFETLIIALISLFLVCIAFLIPTLFPLILLILVVFLIAVLIVSIQKRKK